MIDNLEPSPSAPVIGLIPELVLDHLVSGGGIGEHRQVTVAFLEFSGLSKLGPTQATRPSTTRWNTSLR